MDTKLDDNKTIGRYITTLDEMCKNCHTHLEKRGRNQEGVVEGVVVQIETPYKYCHKCDIESKFDEKIRDGRKKNDRSTKRQASREYAKKISRRGSGRNRS